MLSCPAPWAAVLDSIEPRDAGRSARDCGYLASGRRCLTKEFSEQRDIPLLYSNTQDAVTIFSLFSSIFFRIIVTLPNAYEDEFGSTFWESATRASERHAPPHMAHPLLRAHLARLPARTCAGWLTDPFPIKSALHLSTSALFNTPGHVIPCAPPSPPHPLTFAGKRYVGTMHVSLDGAKEARASQARNQQGRRGAPRLETGRPDYEGVARRVLCPMPHC
jgi:hypothetical protein